MNYRMLAIAEEDLAAAAQYYERQVPGLGNDFLDEFASAMRFVCQQPEAWRAISRLHRRCLMRRFPYAVIFRQEPDFILVAGVMDQRLNPAKLSERLRQT